MDKEQILSELKEIEIILSSNSSAFEAWSKVEALIQKIGEP